MFAPFFPMDFGYGLGPTSGRPVQILAQDGGGCVIDIKDHFFMSEEKNILIPLL